MKNALIVAETNPLHYGHVYLIERAKKEGYRIIMLMSGAFTQRGIPVVTDPFTRGEDLVKNGADVVITLPVQIATSYGEMFSQGAMSIAERFGKIDAVFCGTEWGSIEEFQQIFDDEQDPIFPARLKKSLAEGNSFSESYLLALKEKNHKWNGLFQSNALLAYGYFKALSKLHSHINFHLVERIKEDSKPIVSASYIRIHFDENAEELKKACAGTPPQFSEKKLMESLYTLYRTICLDHYVDWNLYDGYEKGIDDRILKFLRECTSYDDFLENAKTKRYSRWRISRLLLHRFLNMTSNQIQIAANEQKAFHVLAFSESGTAFLKEMKSTDIQLFTNYKSVSKLPSKERGLLSYEEKAMDLWSILTNHSMNRLFQGK